MSHTSSAESLGLPLFEFRVGSVVNGSYRLVLAAAHLAAGDGARVASPAAGSKIP